MVEIEFSTKGKEYLVRRGIKPAKFEIFCDGKLLDQNASIREYQEYLEKSILKLNHKSFTQIVVIGSAGFTPFMQLKVWERRDIIEDLLDIQIFSQMHTILKEKIVKNKDSISETKYQLDLLDQKIEMTKKHMNDLMSIKKADRSVKQAKIEEIQNNISSAMSEIESINLEIEPLMLETRNRDKIKSKLNELQSLYLTIRNKADAIDKDIDFFANNDECPTCRQEIDSYFKQNHVSVQRMKQTGLEDGLLEMKSHVEEVVKSLNDIEEIQLEINRLNNAAMEQTTNIRMYQRNIEALQEELKETVTNDDINVQELMQLEIGKSNTELKHQQLTTEREQHDIANSLLKDGGIKTKIIKQYIPIINKLMNKYLAAMEFFVQFELDEQFNEKIKSRHRDEFTYDSFSEGEKMRIDLSLLFTWRAVAKLRSSTSTNLLIMDEVFDSSLDTTGTDEFLKLITQLATDTNVFVISHKGDQLFDKFHSNIKFEKVKNFSQVAA
jgi:DNA repair exonuclease SbcCD ATPase subunit